MTSNNDLQIGGSQRILLLLHGFCFFARKGALVHACMPLTNTLTLHPPFEKSGYGPVKAFNFYCLVYSMSFDKGINFSS